MTFTYMGDPVPPAVVRFHYRVVLGKIEARKLKVTVRTLLQTVMKDRHVFRDSTAVNEANALAREFYTNLITTCRAERAAGATPVQKKGRKTRKSVVRVKFVGRRVIMPADVFGGNENEYYNGLVLRKSRYRQCGKVKNGFRVRWNDGDEDDW